MAENDRVKYLRKEVERMSQEEFGKRLGVTKVAISKIENGDRNVTDQMRKSICREYGVNESWLRDGTGDVFVKKTAEEELNALADKIMADTPESFRRRFVSMLAKLNDDQWKVLSEMEDIMLSMRDERVHAAGAQPSGSPAANPQRPDNNVSEMQHYTEADLHADLHQEISLQERPVEKSTGSVFTSA